jgi:hypothetical protein
MLSRLNRCMRVRAAVIVAVLYAVCSMTPALALAFVDGAAAEHCFTQHQHHGGTTGHVHDDGTVHHHGHDHGTPAQHSDGNSHPASCCGLFCLSALPATGHFGIGATIRGLVLALPLQESIAGRGPDRIDRPPIALLSF